MNLISLFGWLFATLGLNAHAFVSGGGPIAIPHSVATHVAASDKPIVTGGGPIAKN